MSKKKNVTTHLHLELWATACQIKALGDLIAYSRREPSLDEADVLYGIGTLLREIGERLDTRAKQMADGSVTGIG